MGKREIIDTVRQVMGLWVIVTHEKSGIRGAIGIDYCRVRCFFFWQGGMGCDMWDLSSLTRDGTCAPYNGSMES